MFPRAHGHGVPGKPRQKHPAVQPEPDRSPSVELQPGPAGHRPAAGSSAALPGDQAFHGLFLLVFRFKADDLISCRLQFQIDRLNPSWTSSLSLGVIGHSPDRLNFPSTACCLKRSAWLLQRDSVFHNSLKVKHEKLKKSCQDPCLPFFIIIKHSVVFVFIHFKQYSVGTSRTENPHQPDENNKNTDCGPSNYIQTMK